MSRCKSPSCNKYARFGYDKAVFCLQHKEENMKNVTDKMCEHVNCNTRPSFGHVNGKAIFCFKHKENNMIDIRNTNKTCTVDGCNIRASFGLEGGKGILCNKHKQPGMLNVIEKRKCQHDDCITRPQFGDEWGKPIFCVKHKASEMCDVVTRRCSYALCNTIPTFGTEWKKALFCAEHKEEGMKNVSSKKCLHSDCEKQPTFGIEWQKPMFCVEHKEDGMEDVKNKRCLTFACTTLITCPQYKGYCLRCFIHTFPNEPTTKNYKVKEKHIFDFEKEAFPNENISFNKQIAGGCSKRRPDTFIERYTHSVIVECDENQHETYNTTCEIQRLNELFTDLGDRPIVYIRFNPDGYTDKDGTKHLSSFKYDKKLSCPIIRNKKEWQHRLDCLKNAIQYHLDNIPLDPMTITELFFDEK